MPDAPDHVDALARRRTEARMAKDFATADVLRDEIAAAGWEVIDEPGGYGLRPLAEAGQAGPIAAADVMSVLEEPPAFDVSLQWVCEGWPDDIDACDRRLPIARGREARAVRRRRRDRPGGRSLRRRRRAGQSGGRHGMGGCAQRRAQARVRPRPDGPRRVDRADRRRDHPAGRRAQGRHVGIVGPFGIVTRDLREFQEAEGEGPCDAVEGYLMAFRRETLARAGFFDEKFRWYRTADIEWSFRVKDAGMDCRVVDVPVTQTRPPDVVRDRSEGASEVVEAQLLPLPRSLARSLGPCPRGRARDA